MRKEKDVEMLQDEENFHSVKHSMYSTMDSTSESHEFRSVK